MRHYFVAPSRIQSDSFAFDNVQIEFSYLSMFGTVSAAEAFQLVLKAATSGSRNIEKPLGNWCHLADLISGVFALGI